jgi:hypothetical protein
VDTEQTFRVVLSKSTDAGTDRDNPKECGGFAKAIDEDTTRWRQRDSVLLVPSSKCCVIEKRSSDHINHQPYLITHHKTTKIELHIKRWEMGAAAVHNSYKAKR